MRKQLTLEEALALQRARQERRQQQLDATEKLRIKHDGPESATDPEAQADPQE